jgi:hypothetical protein
LSNNDLKKNSGVFCKDLGRNPTKYLDSLFFYSFSPKARKPEAQTQSQWQTPPGFGKINTGKNTPHGQEIATRVPKHYW